MLFPLLEILDRAETGPRMTEKEFDIKLFRTIQRLVKEHDIKYNPEEIVPTDDTLAKDVFEAGFQLAAEMGFYNISSKRQILLDESELKYVLRRLPDVVVGGEDKDQVFIYPRKIEDRRLPIVWAGCAGQPFTEEMYARVHQGCAQLPIADVLSIGHLISVEGRWIKPGSPYEVLGSIKEVQLNRQLLTAAGRPGMPVDTGPNTPITAIGVIAGFSKEFGQRPSDFWLIPVLNEMKTDYDRLARVVYCMQMGCNIIVLQDPIIGGIGGGPEGIALLGVSERILGAAIYQATTNIWHPLSMKYRGGATTPPYVMWAQNAAGQALAKYTRLISDGNVFTVAKAGTDMELWEIAANTLGMVVSGLHAGPGIGGAVEPDYETPLGPKLMGEVAYAAVKFNRKDANELVKTIMKKYVDKLDNPPPSKKFQECYDPTTLQPRKEWLDTYLEVRKELEDMGLDFSYAFEREYRFMEERS